MRLGSSTIPQRTRLNCWPGNILTRQSKRSSRQCGLQEKWWLLFLCCLWSSSGWFGTSQFNNKCSCLPGNSQKSQGGYLAKETRMLTEWVLVLHCSAQPHSAVATMSFLNSWSWEVFPHPPCNLICSVRLPSVPKDEKAPLRSALPLQWICSKLSQ